MDTEWFSEFFLYDPKQNSGALLVLAALFALYPSIEEKKIEVTTNSFALEVVFPHPAPPPFLLEEKVREIRKKNPHLRTLHMVASNAKVFLEKKGISFPPVEEAELLSLVEIGDFVYPSLKKNVDTFAEIGPLTIRSLSKPTKNTLRIEGVFGGSSKSFARKHLPDSTPLHLLVGEKGQYFSSTEEGILWKTRGLEKKEEIARTFFLNKGVRISSPNPKMRKKVLPTLLQEGIVWEEIPYFDESRVEGLFFPILGTFLVGVDSRENSISFLQSIAKSFTIMDFTYSLLWRGGSARRKGNPLLLRALEELALPFAREEGDVAEVLFVGQDALERKWPLFSIREEGPFVVGRTVLERVFAVLLEQKQRESV